MELRGPGGGRHAVRGGDRRGREARKLLLTLLLVAVSLAGLGVSQTVDSGTVTMRRWRSSSSPQAQVFTTCT